MNFSVPYTLIYVVKSHASKHFVLNTHAFFISNTFISNARLKWEKHQAKLSKNLRLNFYYLKLVHFLHPRYHPKIIGDILKNVQKTSTPFNEVIWLMTMKTRLRMKNRSYRYDIYGPRPDINSHGHKHF